MKHWQWIGILGCIACSDVRLELEARDLDLVEVDNKLEIVGDFCTSAAASVDFPVKIMFVVDGSDLCSFPIRTASG
ncbi:MAG: hypothetical protein R3C68_10980 [Myxococcota bacterium]